MKFTIDDFNRMFPTEEACFDYIVTERFLNYRCGKCGKPYKYRVKGRKAMVCACGAQITPLSGSIFEKSSTSLKNWFFAIYLFSQSKHGVSSMELQRHLGVTYKTAWRMAKKIRELMEENDDGKLSGTVEADEAYVGGRRPGIKGRGAKGKNIVFGMVQRGGKVKTKIIERVNQPTLMGLLKENVRKGTKLMTDEYRSYNQAHQIFRHNRLHHGEGCYGYWYDGLNIHTNTIEGFWSGLKRALKGTYCSVSKKYLQSYLNEATFRYNQRISPLPAFPVLLQRISLYAEGT